ncbi:hypothetical protein ACRAWD_32155, partial [Caulobacter segnis]
EPLRLLRPHRIAEAAHRHDLNSWSGRRSRRRLGQHLRFFHHTLDQPAANLHLFTDPFSPTPDAGNEYITGVALTCRRALSPRICGTFPLWSPAVKRSRPMARARDRHLH